MVSKIKIWLGVVVSIFTTMLLGLELSFNVYAVQLKKAFNYSQTNVDLISASGIIGMGASLSETAVTATFGYKAGYFVIWFLTSVSALLMWLTVVYKEIFRHWPIVICMIQFLINGSQNAGSTRLAAIAVTNFPTEHTGKLIGIYFAAIALGKLFYGEIFENVFHLDLCSFFLALSIGYAVFIAMCVFLHKPQTDSTSTLSDYEVIQENCSQSISLSEMLSDRFFHLTFWPSALFYCINIIFMNNLTSIAYSMEAHNPMNFVYIMSLTLVFVRVAMGLIYDKFRSHICGLLIILGASLSTCAGVTLLIVWPTTTVLYLATVLLGIGLSCGVSFPSSVLAAHFGKEKLQYIIGFVYCFTAISSLVFQFLVGHLYDTNVSAKGLCYGRWCFFLSSLILLLILVCGLVVHCLNLYITVSSRRDPYQK